jgi:hypothetical protein
MLEPLVSVVAMPFPVLPAAMLGELGDKFCLSPDHEVLTKRGWIAIADVILEDKVAQRAEDGTLEWVHPTDRIEMNHTGEMYEVKCESGDSLLVSPEHKLFGMYRKHTDTDVRDMHGMTDITHGTYDTFLEQAKDVSNTINRTFYQVNENNKLDKILTVKHQQSNPTGKIYCLTVP